MKKLFVALVVMCLSAGAFSMLPPSTAQPPSAHHEIVLPAAYIADLTSLSVSPVTPDKSLVAHAGSTENYSKQPATLTVGGQVCNAIDQYRLR